VTVSGAERALPPEVDQAAYRIVQEALTNVSRHAGRVGGEGQVSASVHLRYASDALEIQVDDDGVGIGHGNHTVNGTTTGNGAGHGADAGRGLGLIGMRERVTALGGRLHAGPTDGGGFRVRAEIPAS